MGDIGYSRRDHVVRIYRQSDRRIVVELDNGDRKRSRIVPIRHSNRAPEIRSVSELASLLFDTSAIRAELARWRQVRRASLRPPQGDPTEHQLDRICLRIDDERLAGLPIEQALRRALRERRSGGPPFPRLMPLPARVAQIPFTLPLRFLQLDPSSDFHLRQTVKNVFRSHVRKRDLASVMQVHEGASRGFSRWALPPGWRTVDVLHLDRLAGDKDRLLMMSAPEEAGTLGWLARCVEVWRTRLVVIRGQVDDEMHVLRRFAHRLAAQGGPAIWLVDAKTSKLPARLREFYSQLIHDTPIDLAAAIAARSSPDPASDTLIVGGGREELVRVSTLGRRISNIARQLNDPNPSIRAESAGKLWSSIAESGLDLGTATTKFTTAVRGLTGIAKRFPTLRFDVHEGDGLVPLGRSIGKLRRSLPRPTGRARDVRAILDRSGPRFVNPSLWRVDATTGEKEPIPKSARLQHAQPIVFGVQLGPRDDYAPVLDAIAIVEEPFKWSEGQEGVWLSVGVTGVDFCVIGAAIQQVWLPRQGASDLVEFLVQPTQAGVNQLRFCVYYGADLLQSHRLAALVADSSSETKANAGASSSLAKALGVSPERVNDAGWLARMEYVAAADLAAPPANRDVALSVFANTLDGRRIFTVRGSEGFEISVTSDISKYVEDVRKQLEAISRDKFNFYAFRERTNVPRHSGTPDQRDAALLSLARVGRILFDAILKEADQDLIAADLAGQRRVIHVAHSLLENVIPWAALYDRPYDANRQTDDAGLPVVPAVCPAGLPDASGQFAADTCGTHPTCPLSPRGRKESAAAGRGVADDTIVCARHFWGFRHIIEIPPLQQDDPAASATGSATATSVSRWTATSASKPASLLLGYNGALATVDAHRTELDGLVKQQHKVSAIWRDTRLRDELLKYLREGRDDLVYLFCHARGGVADPAISPPALEFQETTTSKPVFINAADFRGVKLAKHPLVFLNGCNTAAFSPDALSPFIRKLVRDCDVAGVIGTEIPVFELLAGEMASQFLKRFLDGQQAGQALLASRLNLLARGNPLGLVYTLYGVAELTLVQ
ncbi:MAG: hypothetical protein EKK33_10580 [Bradyrhizobiaceae bacterium]|nr:MAG: hypothetical protein EKK33_10580 [Bradyrhizobiaceae bacterium]